MRTSRSSAELKTRLNVSEISVESPSRTLWIERWVRVRVRRQVDLYYAVVERTMASFQARPPSSTMKQRGLDELDALRRMVAQSILTISAADQAPTACEQPLRFNLNSNCLHVVAMIIVDLTHGSPNEVVGSSRLDPLLAAAPCVRERAGHSCLSPDHIDLEHAAKKRECKCQNERFSPHSVDSMPV